MPDRQDEQWSLSLGQSEQPVQAFVIKRTDGRSGQP
jgi:hypothetical protein